MNHSSDDTCQKSTDISDFNKEQLVMAWHLETWSVTIKVELGS